MHTPRSILGTLALLGSLLLQNVPATAQLAPPTIVQDSHGNFHIDFSTPNVFDLSSDWVSHDDQGHLAGLLRTTDGGEIDLINDISGTCKTSRGVTTVTEQTLIEGVVGGGDQYSAISKFKGTMVGYGSEAKLVGTIKSKACLKFDYAPFSKRKVVVCTKSVTNQTTNHNGRWAIRLKFDNVGKELIGTAIIYISEETAGKEKTYETSLTGRLDPDGEANFKLEPVDDNGIGGTIKLRALVSPGNGGTPPQLLEILEVSGKILGQKFAEVF